jgi:hypothetical protein
MVYVVLSLGEDGIRECNPTKKLIKLTQLMHFDADIALSQGRAVLQSMECGRQ